MLLRELGVLFIHIPKAAGSSVETRLLTIAGRTPTQKGPDYDLLTGWCPERGIWLQHATPQQLVDLDLISRQDLSELYSFTVVRNPYDRAVSDFYFLRGRVGTRASFVSMMRIEGQWATRVTDLNGPANRGDHLRSQYHYLQVDGENVLDLVGRFEDIDSTWSLLSSALGIDSAPLGQTNVGRSPFAHYSHFYSNREKSIADHRYARDLEILEYSFDDRRTASTRLIRPWRRSSVIRERIRSSARQRIEALANGNAR